MAAARMSLFSIARPPRSSPAIVASQAVVENLLDPAVEQPGKPEGERKRGIVFAGFDRVHRLARHAEPAAKLRLAPVALRSQHLQAVLHGLSDVHFPGSRRRFALCQEHMT